MKHNKRFKKRIFEIIQIGNKSDALSSSFDYFIVAAIVLNIAEVCFATFDTSVRFDAILKQIEAATSIIFCIEYLLRLWTADLLYPGRGVFKSRLRFVASFYGIVDLLTFLPYFFPVAAASGRRYSGLHYFLQKHIIHRRGNTMLLSQLADCSCKELYLRPPARLAVLAHGRLSLRIQGIYDSKPFV